MRTAARAEQLQDFVRQFFPFLLCSECLAGKLECEEREVRDAAQLSVGTRNLKLEKGFCYGCRQSGEYVSVLSLR
jgi:hypothetical protein